MVAHHHGHGGESRRTASDGADAALAACQLRVQGIGEGVQVATGGGELLVPQRRGQRWLRICDESGGKLEAPGERGAEHLCAGGAAGVAVSGTAAIDDE